MELQRECANTVRDFTFQEVLLAKPLNIITWPFIARSLLIVLRQHFKPVEAVHVFNAPATEKEVSKLLPGFWCLSEGLEEIICSGSGCLEKWDERKKRRQEECK